MSSFGRDRPRAELASCGNCVRGAASPDPTHRIPYYRTQMGAKVRFRALLLGLLALAALTAVATAAATSAATAATRTAHPRAQVQAGPGAALPAARARPRARARLRGGARLEDRRAPGVRSDRRAAPGNQGAAGSGRPRALRLAIRADPVGCRLPPDDDAGAAQGVPEADWRTPRRVRADRVEPSEGRAEEMGSGREDRGRAALRAPRGVALERPGAAGRGQADDGARPRRLRQPGRRRAARQERQVGELARSRCEVPDPGVPARLAELESRPSDLRDRPRGRALFPVQAQLARVFDARTVAVADRGRCRVGGRPGGSRGARARSEGPVPERLLERLPEVSGDRSVQPRLRRRRVLRPPRGDRPGREPVADAQADVHGEGQPGGVRRRRPRRQHRLPRQLGIRVRARRLARDGLGHDRHRDHLDEAADPVLRGLRQHAGVDGRGPAVIGDRERSRSRIRC